MDSVSVADLKITQREGRIVLTTRSGLALRNPLGEPLMATELGSCLKRDGTLLVDALGRVSGPFKEKRNVGKLIHQYQGNDDWVEHIAVERFEPDGGV